MEDLEVKDEDDFPRKFAVKKVRFTQTLEVCFI